jgi:endonuclease/exonuclease/phosphatase family metal-dependent hydrolase
MNTQKINNIIYLLRTIPTTDIICLQEVFEDILKEQIIHNLRDIYPYYLLGNTHKRYCVGEDSGLLVLSKYPIHYVDEIILDEYYVPDRMANKSLLYFKVGDINLLNTHLQSNNMFDNEELSKKQLLMIKNKSPFDQFIIVGDLNNEQADALLQIPSTNDCPTWNDQILDYILPYQYPDSQLQVCSVNVLTDGLPSGLTSWTNVSDHYPVRCLLKVHCDNCMTNS